MYVKTIHTDMVQGENEENSVISFWVLDHEILNRDCECETKIADAQKGQGPENTHILKLYSSTSLVLHKGYIWHTYTKLLTYSLDINHKRLQKFHTYDTVDQRSACFLLFIIITQLLPGQIFRAHIHKCSIIQLTLKEMALFFLFMKSH